MILVLESELESRSIRVVVGVLNVLTLRSQHVNNQ